MFAGIITRVILCFDLWPCFISWNFYSFFNVLWPHSSLMSQHRLCHTKWCHLIAYSKLVHCTAKTWSIKLHLRLHLKLRLMFLGSDVKSKLSICDFGSECLEKISYISKTVCPNTLSLIFNPLMHRNQFHQWPSIESIRNAPDLSVSKKTWEHFAKTKYLRSQKSDFKN